jgi:hypothetical protein
VAEPPELFQLNALETEQPIGLSGIRPMQPRFNRIEAGLPRTKASLQAHNSSSIFNSQHIKHYYKPFQI